MSATPLNDPSARYQADGLNPVEQEAVRPGANRMTAGVRRLRREAGRRNAVARILAGSGPGDGAPMLSRSQLAEAWGTSE